MTQSREDRDALTLARLRQLCGATPGTDVLFSDREAAREAIDLIARLRKEIEALKGARDFRLLDALFIEHDDRDYPPDPDEADQILEAVKFLIADRDRERKAKERGHLSWLLETGETARLRAENAALRGACEAFVRASESHEGMTLKTLYDVAALARVALGPGATTNNDTPITQEKGDAPLP